MRQLTHYTQNFIGGFHNEEICFSVVDRVDILRGCFRRLRGGGSDNNSANSEQTQSLNEDTGSYDPNEEARGNTNSVGDGDSTGDNDYVTLTIETAYWYTTDNKRLYGRKDGGAWEVLYSGQNEDVHDYKISREYVEFGFEFDILSGTRWPYSQPFWLIREDPDITSEHVIIDPDTPVKDIHIVLEGTVRYSEIWISVNGEQIHYDDWMWSGDQYNWGVTGTIDDFPAVEEVR